MQFLLSWCLRDSNLRQSSATIGIAVGAPFANHWTELAVVSIPQVLRPSGPPPPAPRHGQLQPTIRDLGPCICDLFASTSRPTGHLLPSFLLISHNNGHKTDTRRAVQITRSTCRRLSARTQDIAPARVPHFKSVQLVPPQVRVFLHLIRDLNMGDRY